MSAILSKYSIQHIGWFNQTLNPYILNTFHILISNRLAMPVTYVSVVVLWLALMDRVRLIPVVGHLGIGNHAYKCYKTYISTAHSSWKQAFCVRNQWNHTDDNCVLLRASLTHWDGDKMAAISQTMFSNAFSWMKNCEFCLRFHWSLFLRVQLTIFHHWFR